MNKNIMIVIIITLLCILLNSYTMTTKYSGLSSLVTILLILSSFIYYSLNNCLDPIILLMLSVVLFIYNTSIFISFKKFIPTVTTIIKSVENKDNKDDTNDKNNIVELETVIDYNTIFYLLSFGFIFGSMLYSLYCIYTKNKCVGFNKEDININTDIDINTNTDINTNKDIINEKIINPDTFIIEDKQTKQV